MYFSSTFHVGCRSATPLHCVLFCLKGAAAVGDIGILVAEKNNAGTTYLLLLLLGRGIQFHLTKKVLWLSLRSLGCEPLYTNPPPISLQLLIFHSWVNFLLLRKPDSDTRRPRYIYLFWACHLHMSLGLTCLRLSGCRRNSFSNLSLILFFFVFLPHVTADPVAFS